MAWCSWDIIVFVFGLLFIAKIIYGIASFVINFFNLYILGGLLERDLVSRYGKWAIVTGCTSGIGYAFSKELAKRGFNIVLVSRSLDKLNSVASEIENESKQKTRIVVADALERSSIKTIVESVEDLDIGLLVNNVGLNSESGLANILELTRTELLGMVNVNAGYLAALTRALAHKFVAQKRGLIVNIGSTSGYIAVPYQNVYNATKSFTRVFSFCLQHEVNGIEVCYLLPQFVQTNMTKNNSLVHNLPVWTKTPAQYARASISLFGLCEEAAGHWVFEAWAALLTSEFIKDWHRNISTVFINYLRKWDTGKADKKSKKT